MTKEAIPCNGHRCDYHKECKLYDEKAADCFGWWDNDVGWTCPEFVRKTPTIVEKDQGELEIW